MIDGPAAFIAWLGAALMVLSDGRRGQALGLALLTVAMVELAWSGGQMLGAAAILAGGAVSSMQRLRTGGAGWRIMPAGSTPRLVLSIAAALLSLWFAASVTNGAGAPLRFTSLAVLGLMGARALESKDPPIVVAAIAALALALGVAAGLAVPSPGPAPYILAALVAAGVTILPLPEPHAA